MASPPIHRTMYLRSSSLFGYDTVNCLQDIASSTSWRHQQLIQMGMVFSDTCPCSYHLILRRPIFERMQTGLGGNSEQQRLESEVPLTHLDLQFF